MFQLIKYCVLSGLQCMLPELPSGSLLWLYIVFFLYHFGKQSLLWMFSYKTSEKREACIASGEVSGSGLTTYTHFQCESFQQGWKNWKKLFPMSTCHTQLHHIFRMGCIHSKEKKSVLDSWSCNASLLLFILFDHMMLDLGYK